MNPTLRLNQLLTGVLAAVTIFSTASPARAAGPELKLGHVGSPGSLFALSSEEFAKRANAKLGDKAHIVVFGASQLGDDTEMMQKIKLGTIDMTLPSSVMSSLIPEFGLFEMPYIVKDREHMKKIDQQIVEPTLVPLAEKAGYQILGVWENGFRQITNNKQPVNKPEDLKGMKLRVPKGKWRVKMFQDYGASPSAMGLSEVFVALQTGVMDGEENPLTQIYTSKFQEVQKFLSMTDHVYTPAYLVMSAGKFKALPADVQKILADTAKEVQSYVYQTAAEQDKELLEKFKATEMKVNVADRAAFAAASKAVYDEFSKEVPTGKELVEKCQGLAK